MGLQPQTAMLMRMDAEDRHTDHKINQEDTKSSAPKYKINYAWQDAQHDVLVGFVLSKDEWVEG